MELKGVADMEAVTKRLLVDTEVDTKELVGGTEVLRKGVMVALASAITGVLQVAHGVDSQGVATEAHPRQATGVVKAAGVREAAGADPRMGVHTEAAKEAGTREAMEVTTAGIMAGKRLAAPPGSPGNPLAGAHLEVMPPNGDTTNQMRKNFLLFKFNKFKCLEEIAQF